MPNASVSYDDLTLDATGDIAARVFGSLQRFTVVYSPQLRFHGRSAKESTRSTITSHQAEPDFTRHYSFKRACRWATLSLQTDCHTPSIPRGLPHQRGHLQAK